MALVVDLLQQFSFDDSIQVYSMNCKGYCFIVLLLFTQCSQLKPNDVPQTTAKNEGATNTAELLEEWEVLRNAGNFSGLGESVERHLRAVREAGTVISLEAYYYMAQSYQAGPFDKGLAYCDSALSLNAYDSYFYEKCVALKGALLRKSGDYQKSIDYLVPLLSKVANDSVLSEMNWQLSISYRKKDLYDSALYYSQRAERIADKIDNPKYQSFAVQSMANIYSALGEYELALEKEKQLMSIAERMGKKNLIISNTANLAVSYFDLDQKDSALYYYEKAQSLAIELNDLENQCLLYTNFANYQIDKGNYKEAEALMLKALIISEQSGRMDIVLRSYRYLCKAYLGAGHYGDAIKYAKLGITLAKKMETSSEVGPFYELLSDIFKKSGDYQSALKYSEEYRLVMDSVLNISKLETIKELEIKYETEKKQKEIASLIQASAIQDLKLQQKNLIIAIVLVLVLVLVLVYRQHILNEKSKTLEMEQKLLRSQLNPHFIFNALGAIQHFIYQKRDPIETGDYLGKFSQLTRLILSHTQKNLISLEEEIQFLDSYLALQKLRFDEPFDYHINVDQHLEIEEVMIPPMFTQPFIENSIEHGILHKQEKGIIEISFKEQNGLLEIVLSDNGVGREKAAFVKRNQKHRSMATEITLDRLKNLQKEFRKQTNLKIEDLTDSENRVVGTEVVFNLPLIYQD
ncbi:MAG: histidine kinase [Cyclobacteriaceae bacterium]